jgi:hypothetical protein
VRSGLSSRTEMAASVLTAVHSSERMEITSDLPPVITVGLDRAGSEGENSPRDEMSVSPR